METIIPIFLVILFLGYLLSRVDRTDDPEAEADEDDLRYNDTVNSLYDSAAQSAEKNYKEVEEVMNQEYRKTETLELMLKTLRALGCQPTANEDGTISVQYQGENFHMEFGGRYARIWDPMWAGVKADDPDMPKTREAVNAANFNFGPTVVLTAPNDEGVIGFHSRRDIMLHPACPDNEPLVKAVLDSFFDAKEQVRSIYKQINAKQMEDNKNRRPIGFTTSSNQEQD